MSYPQASAGALTVIDTALSNPLGTRRMDEDGNEFIYLTGVASTVAGSCVTFDEAHLTTLAVADAKGRFAVAMAAVVASSYGWYQIYGKATAKVKASFADNGLVFLTSTDGSVDDAAVAGDLVVGAIGRSAIDTPSTGMAYLELNYPFCTDNLGS